MGSSGIKTILWRAAEWAGMNRPRAHIGGSWNVPAALGKKIQLKPVAFRKNLHPQQVCAFAAGIEIKRLFGCVCIRFLGRIKAFKYPYLVIWQDADPEVLYLEGHTISGRGNIDCYFPFVGRIFDGIFNQSPDHFCEGLTGDGYLGYGLHP